MTTYDYSKYKESPSGEAPGAPTDLLKQISTLAEQQRAYEIQIVNLGEELKELMAKHAKIAEDELPRIMDQLELDEFKTKSGLKISIKENIRANISKERNEEAIKWLEEHGYEKLVRREFIILFNREDSPWAAQFEGQMKRRKKPLNCTRKQSVNPSTLTSWAANRLKEGDADLPLELFGVFRQRVSKIEVPK